MKKIFAALLTLLIILSLCSCSNSEKSDGVKATGETSDSTVENADNAHMPKVFYDEERAQKVPETEGFAVRYYDQESKMYGLKTIDGKFDSGVIYYDAYSYTDGYYYVRTKEIKDSGNLDEINSENLVDIYGKTLLEDYLEFFRVSDRFIYAAKAVEIVEGEEYDFYFKVYSDGELGGLTTYGEADENDIKYDADFYIYDTKTENLIENLVFDSEPKSIFWGDFIEYKDDSGEDIIINANGHAVPENALLIYDYDLKESFLVTETSGKGEVYNSYNKLLFTYDKGTDYVPYGYSCGYFSACKQVGSEAKFVALDENGKVASAEFTAPSKKSGELIVCGNVILFSIDSCEYDKVYKICDFNGNVIAKSENRLTNSDFIYSDNPKYYTFSSTEGDLIIVSADGELLFKSFGDESYVRELGGGTYKTVDKEKYYFNLSDKTFNIKAKDVLNEATCFAIVEAEKETESIIDVTTGDKIISGYSHYDSYTIGTDVYIFAENAGDTTDVYLVNFE